MNLTDRAGVCGNFEAFFDVFAACQEGITGLRNGSGRYFFVSSCKHFDTLGLVLSPAKKSTGGLFKPVLPREHG
uniref:Uncharacterized protein n=1 Tax=Corticoviridae sp. TaxID=2832474 RepID=A0A8D9PDZ6_9VIRU|nr:MAG TPA: hypothetical protein [Corticoviridae sp.]